MQKLRINQKGISRFEFAVVAVVFGILASLLLERVLHYQASTERMRFDLVVRELQEASRVRVATLLVTQQAMNYAHLAEENPIAWLAKKPLGYIGEFPGNAEAQMGEEQWGFDMQGKVLLYRSRYTGGFTGIIDKNGLVKVKPSLLYSKNDTSPVGLKLIVQQGSN